MSLHMFHTMPALHVEICKNKNIVKYILLWLNTQSKVFSKQLPATAEISHFYYNCFFKPLQLWDTDAIGDFMITNRTRATAVSFQHDVSTMRRKVMKSSLNNTSTRVYAVSRTHKLIRCDGDIQGSTLVCVRTSAATAAGH